MQLLDDARDLGIGVRIVRSPDDLVGAEVLSREAERNLVGVEADDALAREHLARDCALVRAAEDLELMVEPFEHRHDPTARSLQKRHAQLGVPLADATEDEKADRHLYIERVGQSLAQRQAIDGVGHAFGEAQETAGVRHVTVR